MMRVYLYVCIEASRRQLHQYGSLFTMKLLIYSGKFNQFKGGVPIDRENLLLKRFLYLIIYSF